MPESSQSESNPKGSKSSRLPSPTRTVQGGNSGQENVAVNLGSSSCSNLTTVQRKNRVNSAKYYDIAASILAGGADLDELFLAACKDGDYDKIEHFLLGRSDVIISIDYKDKRTGNTPLIWAAKKGHTKIVQLLLKHGADPTLRNYEGQTALELASPAIKTILFDSVEKTTEASHRLLLQAAWQGNVKIVRKLLKENKVLDINCQNAEGLTPLLLVTRDIQLFERLAIQLNRTYSPVEVIQELLSSRANIHASDSDEKTCLHYASNSRATLAQSLVDVLIRQGSELELRDKRHFMPIHLASQSGNTNVIVTLLDGGSEVNSKGFAGLTPLHITAHHDHNKTATTLLQRGADVTLTDDRGLTAVDLAKSRKMKTTLKEAWTEQTQKKTPTTLAPVRVPSREESRLSSEETIKRRKGEVIFDGLVSTPLPSRSGPIARPNFSRSLSNADKARLAEQQMLKEMDSGRLTPTPKENIRRLGVVRSMKCSTLPKVCTSSSGTPSSPERLSPESPSGRKSSLGDLEVRRSLEDGRNQISLRRSRSLKLASNIVNERRRITPLSTKDGPQEDFCVQNNRVSPVPLEMPNIRTHRRTGSDPFVPPRLSDVASSCDSYLPKRGRSLSSSDEYDVDERMRMTPLRTPLDREMTSLNIPTTIHEVLTPRSSASSVVISIGNTPHTNIPPQLISLHPNSSNVLPPTPTFITQKSYSILDAKLVEMGKDADSSKECSPRSDDDSPRTPREQVQLALSNPMELLRSRSLLKEEFVIDESRPKDPLLQSSGSDPTSSASSLSSSSPRDVNNLVMSKSGKSTRDHHSPLSKVGRYSISGPDNNVGDQFRKKVTRSRSFSSIASKPDEKSSSQSGASSGRSPLQEQKQAAQDVQKVLENKPAKDSKTSEKGNNGQNLNSGSTAMKASSPVAKSSVNSPKNIGSPNSRRAQNSGKSTQLVTPGKQTESEQGNGAHSSRCNVQRSTTSSSAKTNISSNVRTVNSPKIANSSRSSSSSSSTRIISGKGISKSTNNLSSAGITSSNSAKDNNTNLCSSNSPCPSASRRSTLNRKVSNNMESARTVQSNPVSSTENSSKGATNSTRSPSKSPNVSSQKTGVSKPAVVPSSPSKCLGKSTDSTAQQLKTACSVNVILSKKEVDVKDEGHKSNNTVSATTAEIKTVSQATVPKTSVNSVNCPRNQGGTVTNSRLKSNIVRKSDTWKYVKPCPENKEPLVRISLPGEEPKPHICEPGQIGLHTVVQTPVIVNPFENWEQPIGLLTPRTTYEELNVCRGKGTPASSFGYVIGKSSRDAICKFKKTRNVKSAKKKEAKRPVSGGQRQTSGRRRGARSQDSKVGEQTESSGRVKSGKRQRSGRKPKKDVETEALREKASKPDVALISGIGWHVAADCNDTSDVQVAFHLYSSDSDDSDIEEIEELEPKFKLLSARTEGTTSPTTPRFQEIKPSDETRLPLPVMSHDGFLPMNLDMSTEVLPDVKVTEPTFIEPEDDYSNHLDDITNALHKEIMLGKLTPIPEAPSVSLTVQAAINRFDQTVKEDQLNKMLGISPGESLSSQQAEVLRQTQNESRASADSRLRKSGSLRKEVLTNETSKAKAKVAASKHDLSSAQKQGTNAKSASKAKSNITVSRTSSSNVKGSKENLSSNEKVEKSVKSESNLKASEVAEERSDPSNEGKRERKFSESKREDDNEIDEAIEEILNTTGTSFSSFNSTIKSGGTVKSLSNTLTDADRNVLKRLKNNDSVFHAKTLDEARQSDSYAQDTNPDLLKVFHADQFKLGTKVKAMIDAGAEHAQVKAMLEVDEEAKQLAKVMNSFRNMELHAGGSGGSVRGARERRRNNIPRPEASLDGPIMTHKPPSGRPSSAGGHLKGKFHEMKSVTPRLPDTKRSSIENVEPSIAQEERIVLDKLSEVVGGEMEDTLVNAAMLTSQGETVCSRLSGRRGSRSGSACTEDSLSSIGEETIQWKKGNVLGKGAFGTVWCGLTNEGELIAVKQIELNTTDMDKAQREYEKVQEEVELLRNLKHKNIVGYMGTSFEDYIVSIFMQFVPGGSLASILARFGALDETVFRRYTKQILEGVEYLHDNDVIHRDIKGGNVMLMPNGIIKLIDFGCAKRLCINLSMSQSQILKSMKGTPYWMAPEVVNESGHGKKSDIWSIGCTVFEMATRKPPWADMNPMAAIFAIGSDKPVPCLPADKFSPEAQSFVNKCLTKDQNLRLSATELLQDVFILKKNNSKK